MILVAVQYRLIDTKTQMVPRVAGLQIARSFRRPRLLITVRRLETVRRSDPVRRSEQTQNGFIPPLKFILFTRWFMFLGVDLLGLDVLSWLLRNARKSASAQSASAQVIHQR